MKQYLWKIAILVQCVWTSAYAQENQYYYSKDTKVFLSSSDSEILVTFQPKVSAKEKRVLLESLPFANPLFGDGESLSSVVPISIDPSILRIDVSDAIGKITNDRLVICASSMFRSKPDGILFGITDRFMVKLNSSADYFKLELLAKKTGTRIVGYDQRMGIFYTLSATKDSKGNALEMANYFHETGEFEYSTPLFRRYFERQCSNDPYFSNQWALQNTGQNSGVAGIDIDVCNAWEITKGRDEITVAVIDEGVDLGHPDLVDNLLPGYDATGNGSMGNLTGDDGHGTACAGIIAAKGNNGLGVSGIAPECKIIPVRIGFTSADDSECNANWESDDAWIADAIIWATDNGADILSCSFGGGPNNPVITDAIHYAVTAGRGGLGTIVFFSSGNLDQNGVSFPSEVDDAIAVGAISPCGRRKTPDSCDGEDYWGSNYGNKLDISAPGVKIATTDVSGLPGYSNSGCKESYDLDYISDFNGTSSACPVAAGVMALMLSANPCLTQTRARELLELSCTKTGSYCYASSNDHPHGTWNPEVGHGMVSASRAVEYALSEETNVFFNTGGDDQGPSNEFQWVFSGGGCPSMAGGSYFVKRHEVRKTVTFPFTHNPVIVGGANGISAANPNTGANYMHVVSLSNTSATVRTWVYDVTTTITGAAAGWIPFPPSEARFNFAVLSGTNLLDYLQNQVLVNGTQNFQGVYQIESGNHVTTSIPFGDFNCTDGSRVTVEAGKYIAIKDGTNISPSSDGFFHALITPYISCTQFPQGRMPQEDENPIMLPEKFHQEILADEEERDNNTKTDISILPNPNNGRFSIETTGPSGIQSAAVFNLQGEVVYVYTGNSTRILNIDLSFCSSGTYFLKVVNGLGETNMRKVILY